MVSKFFAVASLILSTVATPAFAATDLTGQSINASFMPDATSDMVVQFSSPQTVGAGVEFTGSFSDEFGQNWNLALDFDATGFTLGIATPGNVNGNLKSTFGDVLSIQMSNLSGIGPLLFQGYSCDPVGSFACNTFDGGPDINSLGSDATSAFFALETIRNGETYSFLFAAPGIPEPASWALLIIGFGIVGAGMRLPRTRVAIA